MEIHVRAYMWNAYSSNYSDLRSSDSGTSTTSWSVNLCFTTPGLSHFDVKSVSHRMPHVWTMAFVVTWYHCPTWGQFHKGRFWLWFATCKFAQCKRRLHCVLKLVTLIWQNVTKKGTFSPPLKTKCTWNVSHTSYVLWGIRLHVLTGLEIDRSVRSYLNRAIINHLYNHLPTEHVLSWALLIVSENNLKNSEINHFHVR